MLNYQTIFNINIRFSDIAVIGYLNHSGFGSYFMKKHFFLKQNRLLNIIKKKKLFCIHLQIYQASGPDPIRFIYTHEFM